MTVERVVFKEIRDELASRMFDDEEELNNSVIDAVEFDGICEELAEDIENSEDTCGVVVCMKVDDIVELDVVEWPISSPDVDSMSDSGNEECVLPSDD